MNKQVLVELSKMLVWEAPPELVKWNNILHPNQKSEKKNAYDVCFVPVIVLWMPLPLTIMPSLIIINASDAANALPCVISGPWFPFGMRERRTSAKRWLSIHWPC